MKRKSFLRAFADGIANLGEGMASIFGFGFYHDRPFNYEEYFGTDAELLASDWKSVGDDIRSATGQFKK